MKWSESREMGAVRFADVTEPKQMPSWLSPANGVMAHSLDVVSLRPPRTPGGFVHPSFEGIPHPETHEEVPPPAPETDTPAEAQAGEAAPEEPEEAEPEAPSPPRRDTFADEIAPAVDDEAFAMIAEAVENVTQLRARMAQRAEQQLVELACVVARRVLARELETDRSFVTALVREGLEALTDADGFEVRIGEGFADVRRELSSRLEGSGKACRVVVDPALPPFGCVVETDLGQVDESVENRLELVIRELTDGSDGA